MSKKLLLIEPPFYRLYKDTYALEIFPLSLGYLSATVKRDTNWDVMAYNADFNPNAEIMQVSFLAGTGYRNYLNNLKDTEYNVWQEVKKTISSYRPDVIGITTKSQNFASARTVAKIAKDINPKTVVIVGGPHPTMVGKDVFKCQDIDAIAVGEGEETLVDFLKKLQSGESLDTVNGLMYRKNGIISVTPPRAYIQDLDTLPFPHQSAKDVLKDYDKYQLSAFKSIFATRGCPNNCLFCGSRYLWSTKVRFRSPENVAAEISELRKLGLNVIRFDDDTFGVQRKYIYELTDAISACCPDIKWGCEIHVRLIDDEIVSRMKKAGCFVIQIGIESGNNEMLKKIRKNITIEDAYNASKLIRSHGIEVQTFFMIGFPDETEETLKDTITAIETIDSDAVSYSIFTPYPGTELFTTCKERGLVDDDFDVSLYNHQSPANHFCSHISHERFRELALAAEKMVDRRNNVKLIKKALSVGTLKAVKDMGLRAAASKGLSFIRNYLNNR
ncbi:MAG: B12-binding domain-containing radical SAM protein [Nitrospirae bacterium]|nr:B12-binding domain-containing radical SAM protein [Nitrospirota bacterium]MBF0533892.1 B12-binding domain-containing radical SAM protein [Nitrospirota bacterium]MBF0615399.1 B12-binding domain-containing radical SAM protein [Nitrospirota bacterium]